MWGPKSVGNCWHGCAAAGCQVAGDRIGIHYRGPVFGQELGNGAFAAANATGQAELENTGHYKPSKAKNFCIMVCAPKNSTAKPAPAKNGPKGIYPPGRKRLLIFKAMPMIAPMTDEASKIGTKACQPNQAPNAAEQL